MCIRFVTPKIRASPQIAHFLIKTNISLIFNDLILSTPSYELIYRFTAKSLTQHSYPTSVSRDISSNVASILVAQAVTAASLCRNGNCL